MPATSNRGQVLDKVKEFWTDVTSLDADVLVVATTRPQGYSDDFSQRHYQHRYLIPLSKSHALRYAKRLVQAKYRANTTLEEKIYKRLTVACDQETTQRLMRSPLQVTIMATLVDRIGQPPQERWRLFQQYYEVIYQRETERDIAASVILQQRKADVNAIHARVGLLLQTESEQADTTQSQLDAARFGQLVRTRISEEGHEGEQLELRTREITEAALHRLVFLVGLQDGRVGFEIRSFQEFMAAEALMDGMEGEVRERLEAIAPIVHWRNVFLFAAGKCFAERQYLRDMVIVICEQLNDADGDELAGITLAGSRLALDLLDEGIAKEQPKYARSLFRLACRLMDLPDVEANTKLAAIYDCQLDSHYQDEIQRRIQSHLSDPHDGVWTVLTGLINQEVKWAESIADIYWPKDTEEQRNIIALSTLNALNEWSASHFLKVVPILSPSAVISVFQSRPTISMSLRRWQRIKDLVPVPDWYEVIEDLFLVARSR